MIVKIISHTSNAALRNGLNYIADEEKCTTDIIADSDEDVDFYDLKKSLAYVSNDQKTKIRYVSGYMCDNETALQEFDLVAKYHQNRKKKGEDEMGNISYHIVQSFPEELIISDEEVHQCGIELLQKLEKYQGVVASHVNPVLDKEGSMAGRCKHNHIIINAYIHPDFIDPKHPNRVKYNDCNDTYRQLQMYNDEIALSHGLPIIISPSQSNMTSWYEIEAIKKRISWKQQVRNDIDSCLEISNEWEEYINLMKDKGYTIREGKYVTYTTSDGKKVRDIKLGSEYTKEGINHYFYGSDDISMESLESKILRSNSQLIDIEDVLKVYQADDLYVHYFSNKTGKFAELNSLTDQEYESMLCLKNLLNDNRYENFIEIDQKYEVRDEHNNLIATVKGLDINDYRLHFVEMKKDYEVLNDINHLSNNDENDFVMNYKEKIFINNYWISNKTKRPLSIHTYDKNGRRRGILEMVFILAYSFINSEALYWDDPKKTYQSTNRLVYAKKDIKLQNMINALEDTKRFNIRNKKELDQLIKDVGYNIGTLKKKREMLIKKLKESQELVEAYTQWNEIKDFRKQINILDKSDRQKLMASEQEKTLIYIKASNVYRRAGIESNEDLKKFVSEYNRLQNEYKTVNSEIIAKNKDYSRLKNIEYQLQLACNHQYVCGVNYDYAKMKKEGSNHLKNNKQR